MNINSKDSNRFTELDLNKRFDALDSLRGLAACSVLLSHLFLVLPNTQFIGRLDKTPLHIFWAGHESVILFFILSGLVLSLPFINRKVIKYEDFLVKRICRIYIPYLISILLSIFLMSLFYSGSISDLNKWFNGTWNEPLTNSMTINHVLMLGDFRSYTLNSVIWSLVHEMRISIIFPLLMFYIVLKFDWKKSIGFAFAGTVLSFIIWYLCNKYLKVNLAKYDTSFLKTINFIAFFIFGALLAKHRQTLHELYGKLRKWIKFHLLVIAILAYTYSFWFLPDINYLHFSFINDWIISIGCIIFIIFCLNSNIFKRILLIEPIKFLGKISYSIYLFHLPILLSLVHLLHGKMPIEWILTIAFFTSISFARLMYQIVEKPSIQLGKMLTNKDRILKQEINH